MITRFKLFESLPEMEGFDRDLLDIFQDFELDNPGIDVSVSTEVSKGGYSLDDGLTIYYFPFVKISNIEVFSLEFADDLCNYINKCYKFGFKTRPYLSIKIGNRVYPISMVEKGGWDRLKIPVDIIWSGENLYP